MNLVLRTRLNESITVLAEILPAAGNLLDVHECKITRSEKGKNQINRFFVDSEPVAAELAGQLIGCIYGFAERTMIRRVAHLLSEYNIREMYRE